MGQKRNDGNRVRDCTRCATHPVTHWYMDVPDPETGELARIKIASKCASHEGDIDLWLTEAYRDEVTKVWRRLRGIDRGVCDDFQINEWGDPLTCASCFYQWYEHEEASAMMAENASAGGGLWQ